MHLECDCIDGSNLNGHKINKESRIKLLTKVNKPAFPHITFYLASENHQPVDFNNETISFT